MLLQAVNLKQPQNVDELWDVLQEAFWNLDPDKLDNIFEAVTTECVQIWERDGDQIGKERHCGYRKRKRETGGRPKSTHTRTFFDKIRGCS